MIQNLFRAALYSVALTCSAAGDAENIPLTRDRFDVQGEVAFEQLDGRQAMRLGAPANGKRAGGAVDLKGMRFSTGVIAFDMRCRVARFRQPHGRNFLLQPPRRAHRRLSRPGLAACRLAFVVTDATNGGTAAAAIIVPVAGVRLH